MLTATKKITLATVKSFIRKNRESLLIMTKSHFDGMTDGIQQCSDREFSPALDSDNPCTENLGIHGVWLVGGSRNWFEAVETETHIGFHVCNCCGSFELAIAK